MSGIGWEFYGLTLLTILISAILGLSVWFGAKNTHVSHVDTMAGDEGED